MPSRVVVVDDDADLRKMLAAQLQRRGYEVRTASSGEEALAATCESDADIVITDISMRGMSGLELCKRFVASGRDTPVLVLTAFGSLDTAVDALRAGATDFITKPVDVELLMFSLERALEQRSMKQEVHRLRELVKAPSVNEDWIADSEPMHRVRSTLQRVANTDVSVLISGESGTGKEVAARMVHEHSSRRDGPFVAINCSALPESLMESELFGHRRGAFTGAVTDRDGLFARAHGGTLFLDEIGELPLGLQPKLLRALQERRIRRVGDDVEVPVDVRFVSASNRDLEHMVELGTFREDLFYRINVVVVHLPPLSARGNDVLLLAQHFINRYAAATGKPVQGLSPAAAAALLHHHWPGNVRELGNCIERAVALTEHEQIVVEDLPEKLRKQDSQPVLPTSRCLEDLPPLSEIEKRYILWVYEAVGGSSSRAVQVLGMDRKTLYRRLQQYRVVPGSEPPGAT